nr:MDR family MFS transporter [Nakamurella flava]
MTTATAPAQGAAAAASPAGFTHAQIRTIIFGLMAGMFLAALDMTIVSTSIRTIADDLQGLSAQAWVTTAYLITSTITTPLYGKLSDIYGRRPMFLIAISIFVVGSVACTFSTSMYELAAFRALQGLGAGGLMSMAFAILADIVPPRERAKYQGYFLAVFGTSSVIGPLVGGFFAGAESILGVTGWRWVFLINVPIGIIALIVVAKVLHLPHIRHDHRIDWWGAAALIIGLVPLLLVAEQGREWGWGSLGVISLIALGVVGLVAFVLVEIRMKDEALIPMRLFRSRVFSMGLGANVLIGIGMFGAISVIPLYLQLVKGASPTESGLLMIPMMIGIMGGSIVSGQLTSKTGRYKIFPVIGTALLTAAFLLLLTVTIDTNIWLLFGNFFLLGLGLGLNMQTLMIAVQNAAPAKDMGVSTSSATFFRQLGGTLGVAVFISLLFNAWPTNIVSSVATAGSNPSFQQAIGAAVADPNSGSHGVATALAAAGQGDLSGMESIGSSLTNNSSFLSTLDPAIARPFQEAFVTSAQIVYLCAAILAALAFVVVLLMKEMPLRTMSAIQERMTEDASIAAETLTVAEPMEADQAAPTKSLAGSNGHTDGAVPAGVSNGTVLNGTPVNGSANGHHGRHAGSAATEAPVPVRRGRHAAPDDEDDVATAGSAGRHGA